MDTPEKESLAEAGGVDAVAPNALEEPRLSIQQVLALQGRIALEQQMQSGASWFGTIAWLSVLNMGLIVSAAGVTFIGALDTALYLSLLAHHIGGGPILWGLALAFNAAAVGFFLFLQKKAKERRLWAYWVGLVLFSLDAVLGYFVFKSLIGAAFHGFGLMGIWSGLQAARTIEAVEAAGRIEAPEDPALLIPPP